VRLRDIITFREDLFFEGAVQIDWFYQPDKAAKVSESFVFHGKEYFGVSDENYGRKMTDTARFTQIIASKLDEDQRSNTFTLAIAGYGTGKSHLAVALAQLLSGKDYMPETYQKIINNISRVDKQAAKTIESYTKRPNLVLTLNGMRDFNLHYEMLRAAQRSLKLYGISDDRLKKLNRAHETALRFLERNALTGSNIFEQKAQEKNWLETGETLISRLRDQLGQDDDVFAIINAVYEEISGHEIRWDEGVSGGAVLETLVSEYCGVSGAFEKVILIFDEFGRYLEYASAASAHAGDSALQQIFEAAQNAEGTIQVINFIQSDIKTYLQRVDHTSNISRYIGRYDASDKYYLSSNLETVFANLIDRRDKCAFDNTIKAWQKSHEVSWTVLHENMNRWLPLKGLWRDYNLFRQVIVEGIYPMHPLGTYMLTQLSDYLQNRSSLTLVNRFITSLGDYEFVENSIPPVVTPANLLSGDLFIEILSAEQEGRQLSQHCIRFDNIMRKYGDKLSEDTLKVLRSNLALRIVRFRTTSYEDAKNALAICAGMEVAAIENALHWLENEYAVLGFDERACCFDFLEDSSGAHDFRTFLRRIRAGKALPLSILDDSKIREMAGVLSPIGTNFALEKKIKSNEWQFEQDLFTITDLTPFLLESKIADWNTAVTPEKAKGRLIWLYINREVQPKILDDVIELAGKLENKPIIMMLLNDIENKLQNAMLDYFILSEVGEADRRKYGRHYDDAVMQAEENVRVQVDILKRERNWVSSNGITNVSERLGMWLTKRFMEIYPYAVAFDFDGFDGKQPGRAKKAYCSILKLLLSGNINNNTIHGFPVEVRNRFEATLFETGGNSWKAVNSQYQIVPPKEKTARYVFDLLEKSLNENQAINCKDVLKELCMPPYGLNEYIAIYMIAVICANLSYCIRPQYGDTTFSVVNWKDQFVGDNRIDVQVFQRTVLKLVDAGKIIDKFLHLFKLIEENKDVEKVVDLKTELNRLALSEELPNELDAQYKLCQYRLEEGERALVTWNNKLLDIVDKLAESEEEQDTYKALTAMQAINGMSSYGLGGNYPLTQPQISKLIELEKRAKKVSEPQLLEWIKDLKCHSVGDMTNFEKHMRRIEELLKSLRYFDEARAVVSQAQRELENRSAIQARQNLRENCSNFMSETTLNTYVAYVSLLDWEKKAVSLMDLIVKNRGVLGRDEESIEKKIARRLDEIRQKSTNIKDEMDSIWNGIFDMEDIDAIKRMISRIDSVCQKGITKKDSDDFQTLKSVLSGFLNSVDSLGELKNRRADFEACFEELREKYSDEDLEVDVSQILEAIAQKIRHAMNERDNAWKLRFIDSFRDDFSRQQILKWQDDTIVIPEYLSIRTIHDYQAIGVRAERLLSVANVEDVIHHFLKLTREERLACIDKLKSITDSA
jgi:hypothetical protein